MLVLLLHVALRSAGPSAAAGVGPVGEPVGPRSALGLGPGRGALHAAGHCGAARRPHGSLRRPTAAPKGSPAGHRRLTAIWPSRPATKTKARIETKFNFKRKKLYEKKEEIFLQDFREDMYTITGKFDQKFSGRISDF